MAVSRQAGVCLVSSSYPSPAAPTRGAFVEDLALGLHQNVPVTVVAPRVYPDDPPMETRKGIPICRFSYGSSGLLLKEYGGTPMLLMIRYLLAGMLATIRRGRGTGLLFAHWVIPAGVIGAAASVVTRRPLVLFAHGSDICVYAQKNVFYRRLTRWVLGRSRHVFAVSGEIESILTGGFGVPAERVSRVSCGVDTDIFRPADRPLPTGKGPVKLLFVGDMVPAKGVPELVDAVLALIGGGKDIELELIGDGPLREPLLARVADAGEGKRIRFSGSLPREEVAARMRAVHCLVLPSHNEGMPVCVMEALTSGIPVVATRVGGIPDQVEEGVTGLLVPPRDTGQLARRLGELADDRGLLARLTDGAGKTGNRFSLADRQEEVRAVIKKLTG